MKQLQLTGKRFSRLVVLKKGMIHISPSGCKKTTWICQCDCGNIKTIIGTKLNNGNAKSCGCLRKDKLTKHGLHKHKLYESFMRIKGRCYNKRNPLYKYYGDRGIKVCDEWLNNFKAFYDWAIDNGWKEGLDIDRFPDNDGNYEPSNCRFTIHRNNILNRRLVQCNNTSGYTGIYIDKRYNRWNATIKIRRIDNYIGSFDNKKQAVEARNNYIIENNLQHEYKIQEWNG